jgi:hypothetical protein
MTPECAVRIVAAVSHWTRPEAASWLRALWLPTPSPTSVVRTPSHRDTRTGRILIVDRSGPTDEGAATVNRGKTPPVDPLTAGERRAMWIAAGVVVGAIAAAAMAWAVTDHSSTYNRSGDGCVNVTTASSMGGGLEHACGTAARDWCRSVSIQHDAHAQAVQAQCRIAGILP